VKTSTAPLSQEVSLPYKPQTVTNVSAGYTLGLLGNAVESMSGRLCKPLAQDRGAGPHILVLSCCDEALDSHCGSHFRLIERLFSQIEGVVQINDLLTIMSEVVVVAGESR